MDVRRMNETPVLVPRSQSYGRCQNIYHFSTGQIVKEVQKALGLWRREKWGQQGLGKLLWLVDTQCIRNTLNDSLETRSVE